MTAATEKKEKKKTKYNPTQIPDLNAMYTHRQNLADRFDMPLDFERLEEAHKDPHRTYPSPESLLRAFIGYLQYCKQARRSPNISGFAIYDGVTEITIQYARSLEGYEFVDDYINTALKDIYINKMFSDWNSVPAERFLNVGLNWTPKEKTVNNNSILIYNDMTDVDIRRKLTEIRKQIKDQEQNADVVTLQSDQFTVTDVDTDVETDNDIDMDF